MRETWDFSMPLVEAMTTQRAVRRLKPDPVDDALVLRLIELALKAPTGSNAQNWEFIVVRDAAVKAKLARLNRQARVARINGRIDRRACIGLRAGTPLPTQEARRDCTRLSA